MKKSKPFAVMTLTAILIGMGGGFISDATQVSAQSNRVAPELVAPTIKNLYVVTQTANVRQSANLTSKVVEWAPKGSVVESLGETKTFVKIKQDGKVGYISKKMVKSVSYKEGMKQKYKYQTSLLKGFKDMGNGKFVAHFGKTPLVTVQYHNQNPEIVTMSIDYGTVYELAKKDEDMKSVEFIGQKTDLFFSTVYGKNSPDYKLFKKKLDGATYDTPKAYMFEIGDTRAVLDQSQLPYVLDISITKKNNPLIFKEKQVRQVTSETKSYKDPQMHDAIGKLKKKAYIHVLGETKSFVYIKQGNTYQYVPKMYVTKSEVKKPLSSKTASRSEMNRAFGSTMTKVNENRYEKKMGKKKVAIVEFDNATSRTPVLKVDLEALILLPYSKYNENEALYEKTSDIDDSEVIPGVTVNHDGTISGNDGKEVRDVYDWREHFSKEDILKAKAIKKELDPILKAYSESLLGKGTKEAKQLNSLFYKEDYNLYLELNGQKLMSPTFQSGEDYFIKLFFK